MKKVYEKIEEAKTKLGLSSRALSVRIGHHASYLSQIRVLSTEKQERLIRELNAAIDGEKVKTDSQIIDELKNAKNDAINLNVVISDLEAYKKQAAFDLTEAHNRIKDLKERLESYRKDNSLLTNKIEDLNLSINSCEVDNKSWSENWRMLDIELKNCKHERDDVTKKLASKEQILDDYYKDLDNLEFDLNEKQSQLDQSIENNKALAEYQDVLECKVKRFGAYIFLLIVTLSITMIVFMIYVQAH